MSKSQTKAMLSLSSISRLLFTLNSFPKPKQPIKLIMWKYCSGYVVLCIEKGHKLWPNDWILHHDSALAHKVLSGDAVSGPKLDH
jgi:hypothetical protein